MNNIDLNTITVAEAKAAGVSGMDMLTVLRNPVNSAVTKKNEEFAADLKAKTAKKIRVKAKTPKKKIATKLSWQFKNADGTTRLDEFFAGMTELLGDNFNTWYGDEDFKDAIATVLEDIFPKSDLADQSNTHIHKGSQQVVNLVRCLARISEDTPESRELLTGSFSFCYKAPLMAAINTKLVPSVEGANALNYLKSITVK